MRAALLLSILLLVACEPEREAVAGSKLLVLEGASALTGQLTIAESAIVVDGNKILRVGKIGQFLYPNDATIVDLTGKWIVPGYIDTHVHLTDPESLDQVLRTLVENGITTVRIAAGFAETNVALRDAIASGDRFGPRIQTAGMPIDTPDGPMSWMVQVETAEQMREEVRKQVAEGVDYIKLYRTIGPDLAIAAIDEAHALGIKVIGHLNMTTWSEASTMGIDGLLHSGVFAPTWELAPRSEWDTIRLAFNEGRESGDERGFVILRESVDVDSDATRAWVDDLVAQGTPVEPNLIMLLGLLWGNDEEVYQSFEPGLAPPSWQGTWRLAFPYAATAARTDAWVAEGRATYPLFEQLAVKLFRSGAVLSVGTDLMNPWMTPGTSYHRELELLVDAGLTEAEVLKAATYNGAVAMGLDTHIGSIEEGKEADLVVLTADPLLDVKNFREIEIVVLRGEVIRREMVASPDG